VRNYVMKLVPTAWYW